jgi:hypothetical protein
LANQIANHLFSAVLFYIAQRPAASFCSKAAWRVVFPMVWNDGLHVRDIAKGETPLSTIVACPIALDTRLGM